jgi:predicted DNA-binding transcriptional regulator AlpA
LKSKSYQPLLAIFKEAKMPDTGSKKPLRIIRKLPTSDRVGFHPVHVMRKANDPDDDFPAPVQLGPRSVGFIESEIEEWIKRRMAERSSEKEGVQTHSEDRQTQAGQNRLIKLPIAEHSEDSSC